MNRDQVEILLVHQDTLDLDPGAKLNPAKILLGVVGDRDEPDRSLSLKVFLCQLIAAWDERLPENTCPADIAPFHLLARLLVLGMLCAPGDERIERTDIRRSINLGRSFWNWCRTNDDRRRDRGRWSRGGASHALESEDKQPAEEDDAEDGKSPAGADA